MFQAPQEAPARLDRQPKARRLVDWSREVRLVAGLVAPLPRPGHVVSGLLGAGCGRLDSFIPCFAELLGVPFTLDACTLAVSAAAIDEMARLLEAGKITRIRLLLSKFFESRSLKECGYVVDRMTRLGQATAIGQSHAKLFLIQPEGRGDRYVCESSANLRSCSCVEQFSLSNDAELFQFYTAFLERFFHERTQP